MGRSVSSGRVEFDDIDAVLLCHAQHSLSSVVQEASLRHDQSCVIGLRSIGAAQAVCKLTAAGRREHPRASLAFELSLAPATLSPRFRAHRIQAARR
jgi:hypothetical protein